MKGFQKLLKKQSKDLEALNKKHNKEKALMQKQHSSIIDKMTSYFDKSGISAGSGAGLINNNFNNTNSASDPASPKNITEFTDLNQTNSTSLSPFEKKQSSFKTKIKETVDEQTKSWASLVERQQVEVKQLNNERVEQQCICFQQLLMEAQKQRKKDIELRQKKETDQLKSNQAKQSVEDSKRLLADKNFRTKQDRDRRLRELNSTNMKKFIDERKRLANKHQQENSTLVNLVKEEEDTLNEENNKVNSFERIFCP
jgi:phosphatidylinositol phospholipase C, beta